MIKQLVLPFLGVMVFIAIVGYYTKNSDKVNSKINLSSANTQSLPTITIGDDTIKVEIADTDQEREMGLSSRTSLDSDRGMLFVFDNKDVSPIFWMKDTLIPLDIIWINDGKIVKIDANVPVPAEGTSENDLQRYSPGSAIDQVLEVNAGYAANHGISVGHEVDLTSVLK